MKKGLGLIALFTAIISCAPAVVDEAAQHIMIAGSVNVAAKTFNAVYWDNGVMHTLDTRNSHVMASSRNGSDLYILGMYLNTTDESIFCYWKNGSLSQVGEPYSTANSIFAANGNVYISGKLTNTDAGYWVNGVYHSLFSSTNINYMTALGIAVSGTNIAVVGRTNYSLPGGYWLNSVYHEVSGIESWYSPYFVGDTLRILCNTNNGELGYLENGVYTTLIATNFIPNSVDVFGNDVYICGYFTDGSVNRPYYMKNGDLISLNCSYTNGGVGKTLMYNNEVYFAGFVCDYDTPLACLWDSAGTLAILHNNKSSAELFYYTK